MNDLIIKLYSANRLTMRVGGLGRLPSQDSENFPTFNAHHLMYNPYGHLILFLFRLPNSTVED